MLVVGAGAGHAQTGLPAIVELSSLRAADGGDGSVGTMFHGTATTDLVPLIHGDVTGLASVIAGDVNGDGFDDLLIGAYHADVEPGTHGAAYVVFGGPDGFGPEVDLASLLPENGADGSKGFVIGGEDDVWFFGTTTGGGDFNGDGLADVLIGAFDGHGRGYVVFGSSTGFPPFLAVSDLLPENGGDGSVGFVLDGEAANFDAADGVASGDFNGDGVDDVVLGGPNEEGWHGKVYVVFGRSTPFPAIVQLGDLLPQNGGDGREGFIVFGRPIFGRIGQPHSMSSGDVNNDGLDELILGAPLGFETYVLYGGRSPSATIHLEDLLPKNGGDGRVGVVLSGARDGRPGTAVSSGDLNGDGLDDVIIGDPRTPDLREEGAVNVVFAAALSGSATFDLTSLLPENGGDGSRGFVIKGSQTRSWLGSPVSAGGDVNGDGFGDLAISAFDAGPAGEVYLIYGRGHPGSPVVRVDDLRSENGGDGTVGVVFQGIDVHDNTGISISMSGDVNGDGLDDLLIGAPQFAYYYFSRAGRNYVIFGHETDKDEDGISNAWDNCSSAANPDQRDTDADGFGNVCDADLNNDCIVNFADLAAFKSQFMSSDAPHADFDGDGLVAFADLDVLKQAFLSVPGPSGTTATCVLGHTVEPE